MSNLLTDNHIKLWDSNTINRFRKSLLDWYDENKRDLPWRHTKDPYAIWVSEIMAQQTQVATVIPYYHRFLKELPTVEDLAYANEQKLLKLWEGLGYYSRVRNMQKAALTIVNDYNGIFPNTKKDLLALKGVGTYTAGAILSIAFNESEPAVDGNVMRIMARLFEIDLDIGDTKNKKVFEELVRHLIDPIRPGDFNQALMDLGSDICSAHHPKPEISPIKEFNAAYQHNTMDKYPIKLKKTKTKDVYYTALVYRKKNGSYFLQQRENGGLLANMWHFPLVEKKQPSHVFETRAPYDSIGDTQFKGRITHVFSHLKWHIDVLLMPTTTPLPHLKGQWVSADELTNLPLPTPQLKMMALLND